MYMDDVRPCPDGWKIARTIEDAKMFLEAGLVDRCSLDHDMGACKPCQDKGLDIGDMETPVTTFMHWCPHHEDGTRLVYWMIDTGNWPQQRPVVHSANPVGRLRMQQMIARYWDERVPKFTTKDLEP